ncbi:MAG: threonine--tRNA ligase [Candidatus Hadarchaeales archaeon]
MRLLLIHADYLEFEAKEPTPIAEELPEELRSKRFEEPLVVFTAVEEEDIENVQEIVKKAADEISDVKEKVNAKLVVIYPYAHLSSSLAPAESAVETLKMLANELRSRGIETERLPFGWYKSFKISCKGHPLSELSRQISPTVGVTEAVTKEETIKSRWFILEPDGKLHEITMEDGEIRGYDFSRYPELKLFAIHEISRSREAKEEPPHIQLMRRLELVDYEPGSDSGNFRFYPKGRFMKFLLERWVSQRAKEYGAMEIETPIMYDYDHPALKSYLERFPARQYTLKSGKRRFFLRFSACFGQFLLASSAVISYRNLPLRLYEITHYSFRLEKSGELSGLRRLRTFTMPDMHTICADIEQAKEEFKKQFKLCMRCLRDLGIKNYETGIRMTEDFLEKNKEFIISLAKLVRKPVLLEVWSQRYAYFDPKFEFNFVDTTGKASALSTVQMDHENAVRYGITYVDENGCKKHPIILHCSPSGSLERVIYALLEQAYKDMQNGKTPCLPLWLSPTQVRIIPVADRHKKFCERLAQEIEKEGIRVDLDDRGETVGKKIRDAEREWIPYILVVGDEEMKTKKLKVRIRGKKRLKSLALKKLCTEIKRKTVGFPQEPLPLPRKLSARPIFFGG